MRTIGESRRGDQSGPYQPILYHQQQAKAGPSFFLNV